MNVKSSEANSSNLTGSFVSKCAAQLMREKAELYQAAEWPQLPILELCRCPEWKISVTQPFLCKHVTSNKAIVTDPGNLKDYSGPAFPLLLDKEDIHALIPRNLHDKRDFADGDYITDLDVGRLPGWVFMSEKGNKRVRVWEGNGTMEAEIIDQHEGTMWESTQAASVTESKLALLVAQKASEWKKLANQCLKRMPHFIDQRWGEERKQNKKAVNVINIS